MSRARVLDETAVIRLRRRPDGAVGVWVRTPFDVLATRSVRIGVDDPDMIVDATTLLDRAAHGRRRRSRRSTGRRGRRGSIQASPMPSAWEGGALPPDAGFVHVDDVPARTVVGLSRDGAEVARTEVVRRGRRRRCLIRRCSS